jgi:hypothetical protein
MVCFWRLEFNYGLCARWTRSCAVGFGRCPMIAVSMNALRVARLQVQAAESSYSGDGITILIAMFLRGLTSRGSFIHSQFETSSNGHSPRFVYLTIRGLC